MKSSAWQRSTSLGFAIALFWAGGAAAVDGVIEINQATAAAGGVNGSLVADPPGFPVVLTQHGSYRLTGNLTVPDINTTAIQVGASDVDIDLNGFAIVGTFSYTGFPASCIPGTGSGVRSTFSNVGVHDGTIKGMGATGIDVSGEKGKVANVLVEQSGGYGIVVADYSIVSGNRVIANCGAGIAAATTSSVRENVAEFNLFDGITAGPGSSIADNTVNGNGICGIFSYGGSTSASRNTTVNNPRGCGGGNCCAINGARLLDCNLVQNPAGALQRCCPNPGGADICY